MQIFDFPKALFWQFSETFFSRFFVSFFETYFGLDYVTKNSKSSESSITVFFLLK